MILLKRKFLYCFYERSEEILVSERIVSFLIFREDSIILDSFTLKSFFYFLSNKSEFFLTGIRSYTKIFYWIERIHKIKSKWSRLNIFFPTFIWSRRPSNLDICIGNACISESNLIWSICLVSIISYYDIIWSCSDTCSCLTTDDDIIWSWYIHAKRFITKSRIIWSCSIVIESVHIPCAVFHVHEVLR